MTAVRFTVHGKPEPAGSKRGFHAEGEDRHRALELLGRLSPQHDVHLRVIDGEPPSKARPRFTSKGRPYTPQRTIDGEKRLAKGMSDVPKFAGNLSVACIFYRSTRQRIDVDNLLKAILDAGTRAEVWDDDSQVTALIGVIEHDHERPRTIVCFGQHTSSMTRGDDAKVSCESCGKRFTPAGQRRDTARWCSRECRAVLAAPVPCPTCKRPFKRKSGNHKFCSVECRGLAARRKPLCAACGAPVSRAAYRVCRSCWLSKRYGEPARVEVSVEAA